MTITFPDGVGERIEAIAKRHGFASAAEYLMSLVEEAEIEAAARADATGPSSLTPRNREELEKMLDESVASGPSIRVTPEFWEERRRALEERMVKRRDGSP